MFNYFWEGEREGGAEREGDRIWSGLCAESRDWATQAPLMIIDSDYLWGHFQYIPNYCFHTPQTKPESTFSDFSPLFFDDEGFSEPFMLPQFMDGFVPGSTALRFSLPLAELHVEYELIQKRQFHPRQHHTRDVRCSEKFPLWVGSSP